MTHRLPAIFISHGAPLVLLEENPVRSFLANLGRSIPRPKGILCVSAHWDTPHPRITCSSKPPTIHDFYGFPRAYYQQYYRAPGDPSLASRVNQLLQEHNFHPEMDQSRGLDHGAWVPLTFLFPEADIPVIQLSIQTRASTSHHFDLGQALQPLRDEGILILGSGQATHNLSDMVIPDINASPATYAREFDEWLCHAITHQKQDSLLNYRTQAPNAVQSHPTEEHILPLFVPLGAASDSAGKQIHSGFNYAAISMAAYAWEM